MGMMYVGDKGSLNGGLSCCVCYQVSDRLLAPAFFLFNGMSLCTAHFEEISEFNRDKKVSTSGIGGEVYG